MTQFDIVIVQIATILSITPLDVYVFFWLLVAMGIITAMGLVRIYSIFFGTVLGIGIFVLFSTILSPELQTPETLSLISDTFAKILIGSSVYLIFILAFLVPMNGGVNITLPKSTMGTVFQTLILALVFIIFLLSVLLWLVERNYIFIHTDSAFTLIKKLAFYSELQSSLLFIFISSHLPTIIILSIGFIVYKMLFADIVNALVISLIESIKKHKSSVWGGHSVGWHEKEYEWHEDDWFSENEEEHGGHGHH